VCLKKTSNGTFLFFKYFSQNLADFTIFWWSNFYRIWFKCLQNCPPHLKIVTTLPCEIQVIFSDKSSSALTEHKTGFFSPWETVHCGCLSTYKITLHMQQWEPRSASHPLCTRSISLSASVTMTVATTITAASLIIMIYCLFFVSEIIVFNGV